MFIPLSSPKPKNFPVITVVLIVINVIVFFYQMYLEFLSDREYVQFLYDWALVPALLNLSEPQTLLTFLTSMFMHGGISHILGNMWFLWIFGPGVEDEIGKFKYLSFYLVGGLIASLSELIFSLGSMIPSLGASGAISAIMGFYMVAFPAREIRILSSSYVRIYKSYVPAFYILLTWGILQFFNGVGSLSSGQSGGIAWFAHLGGFLFGVVVGWVWKKLAKPISVDYGLQVSSMTS